MLRGRSSRRRAKLIPAAHPEVETWGIGVSAARWRLPRRRHIVNRLREADASNIIFGLHVPITALPFHKLSERHPGVTTAVGDGYNEAARVCLDRHHVSPIAFIIQRQTNSAPEVWEVIAVWQETNQRERNAWANVTDATEAGAYGFALAAVELEGLVAVRRAETGTGADYYISKPGVLRKISRIAFG